jgi:hypothetical protein
MLTSAVQPPGLHRHLPQTYGTCRDRTTLSSMPSLASSPSLRHHRTSHWPHHRTVTTSSEHSWGQPPPCGSRSYRSPTPRYPSTVIPLPGDLDRTFKLPCGFKGSGNCKGSTGLASTHRSASRLARVSPPTQSYRKEAPALASRCNGSRDIRP